jgi:hypothetical protein
VVLAKRSKKSGSGAAVTLMRIVFVGVLAFGGWYFWKRSQGKPPELPRWLAFWNAEKPNRRETPAPEASTNAARETHPKTNTPPPAPPKETNIIVVHPTNAVPREEPEHESRQFRNVRNVLDAQIALARRGISVGPIDGANGENMHRALLAWQVHNNLPVSGELDAESKAALLVEEPLFIQYTVTEADLHRLMHIPPTWLGKSQVDRLDYETILELLAEKSRSSTEFLKHLNPQIDWSHVTAGTLIKMPRIDPPPALERAAFVRVHLYTKTLDVFGAKTNLIAHYPCSIAAKVEKRPVGLLHVLKAAANPTYLFDPEVFAESAEAKKIGRKLKIPPGPNNPVGTAWIGLDKPGYGIHGTPKPESVGRTESHGCFRLANWNAEQLLQLVWTGMPVNVER